MIAEIGVALCLFMIATLIAAKYQMAKAAASWVAGIVAVAVAVDLLSRAVAQRPVFAISNSRPTEGVQKVKPNSKNAVPARPVVKANVTRADGGSVTTNLGYGIAIAKDSSLHREWIAVDFPDMPIAVQGTPGVRTIYKSGEYRGEYRYQADFDLEFKQDVSAYEIRFLVFDLWGEHVRTLTYDEVADRKGGSRASVKGFWDLNSENEVEQHYASIVYVARARLADGKVVQAPVDPVVEEAKKFSDRFTAEELEPEPSKQEKKPS